MFDARKLLTQMMGGGSRQAADSAATGADGAGSDPLREVGGLLGSVFGQATHGLKEGASEIEKRTGIGGTIGDAVEKATGRSPGEIVEQVKAIASKNKLATGAALGGLGALLLGTKTGRGMAGQAATLGGLALIGGLAYKAFRNHQEGKPLLSGPADRIDASPTDSPFGETGDDARDQETAMLVLRAMIAAAASDGQIDNDERSRIIGGLSDAGLDVHAARFLDAEFASPLTPVLLAAAATTPELKAQVYTAARVAVGEANAAEAAFLAALVRALGLDEKVVAHLDAAVGQARH